MVNLKRPFPFFLNNDRGNFMLIVGVSIFTYTFLEVFKPFGEDLPESLEVPLYALITFAVMNFNLLLLPRLAPRLFDNAQWTLGKYILFNLYNLVSISLIISISHYFTRDLADCPPFLTSFAVDLWKTFAIGIFPLVVITFSLENMLLNQALKAGQQATGRLREYRKRAQVEGSSKVTVHSETRETVDIELTAFLFAQAENNYCELFWLDNEEVRSKLIRSTLKNLEDQIGKGNILRCHRSYLVNLEQVAEVSGNTNGYRLHIPMVAGDIPVSRTLGKDILERIDQMSEVA
jgi:hypothetical protein